MIIIMNSSSNQHYTNIKTFKVGNFLELANLDEKIDGLGIIEYIMYNIYLSNIKCMDDIMVGIITVTDKR